MFVDWGWAYSYFANGFIVDWFASVLIPSWDIFCNHVLLFIWHPFDFIHPHMSSWIVIWNEACTGLFYSYTLCSVSLFHLPLFRIPVHGVHHYSYFRPWEQRVTEDTYLVVNRLHVAVWELSSGERVQWERKIWGIQSWVWHCWWWLCLTTTLRRSRMKKFDWDYSCSYCCWSCPDCYCKSWTKHEKKSGTTFAAGSPG